MNAVTNKVLKKIDLAAANPLRYFGHLLSQPEVIVIEPTNYCNSSCLKCLRRYDKQNRNLGLLTIDNLNKILHKIPRTIKFIGINGFGEPLLHPQFSHMLEIIRAYSKNIKIGFHTNGVLLNDKIIDACLKNKVSDIEISIDSHIEESYKIMHSAAFSLELVKKNIQALVKKRNSAHSNLKIGIAYIMQYENRGYLPEFIRWAYDLGVDFVGPVKPINPLYGYKMDQWSDPLADMQKEIELSKEIAASLSFEVQFPVLRERKPGSANIAPLKNFACAFPYSLYPIITWDGYALPCVWIQDVKYNCGNLFTDSFPEIWNGKKIREIRKTFARNKYLKACDNCRPASLIS